jgi:uncharacterized OB-fold protein
MQEAKQAVDAASKPPEYFPADRPWEERNGVINLKAMRCSACGTRAFPARMICSCCGAETGLETVSLSPRGTLYTYSEVHVAPKDFPTPYVIGFVDFEEGVRVFGQVEGSASSLKPDQQVETTTGIVRIRANGTPVISYKFRSIQA